MRHFADVLKGMFTGTDPQGLPATASEMTLHDALRICAGHALNDDGPTLARTALRQLGVCRYRCESDSHDQR